MSLSTLDKRAGLSVHPDTEDEDGGDFDLNIRGRLDFVASHESSSLGKYLFKCADHLTYNPANKRFLEDFGKHHEMERDLSIVRSAIASSRPTVSHVCLHFIS